MSTSTHKRLAYIDALRGFTMFFVVFWHVLYYGFGMEQHSTLSYVFWTFRMPMFFFISGFVAYKPLSNWTVKTTFVKLAEKARFLVIPSLIFLVIYQLVLGNDPVSAILETGIGAYWFTIALFLMFVVYYIVAMALRKTNSQLLFFLVLAVLSVAFFCCRPFIDSARVYELLKLNGFFNYFQFFATGLAVKAFFPFFEKVLKNEIVKAVLPVTFFVLCAVVLTSGNVSATDGSVLLRLINYIAVRYVGLFMVFSIFMSLESFFEAGGKVSKTMQYVGRRTLEVYLLHYLLLPSGISNWYEPISGDSYIIFQFLLTGGIAVLVLAGSLALAKIIGYSDFLRKYLLGENF